MNWLFEHMDDPGMIIFWYQRGSLILQDIDTLPNSSGTGDAAAYSQADISQLMDMGFTEVQAKKALKETV